MKQHALGDYVMICNSMQTRYSLRWVGIKQFQETIDTIIKHALGDYVMICNSMQTRYTLRLKQFQATIDTTIKYGWIWLLNDVINK